jgi:hypothetical protein
VTVSFAQYQADVLEGLSSSDFGEGIEYQALGTGSFVEVRVMRVYELRDYDPERLKLGFGTRTTRKPIVIYASKNVIETLTPQKDVIRWKDVEYTVAATVSDQPGAWRAYGV